MELKIIGRWYEILVFLRVNEINSLQIFYDLFISIRKIKYRK
jgi:hypothetical protein